MEFISLDDLLVDFYDEEYIRLLISDLRLLKLGDPMPSGICIFEKLDDSSVVLLDDLDVDFTGYKLTIDDLEGFLLDRAKRGRSRPPGMV